MLALDTKKVYHPYFIMTSKYWTNQITLVEINWKIQQYYCFYYLSTPIKYKQTKPNNDENIGNELCLWGKTQLTCTSHLAVGSVFFFPFGHDSSNPVFIANRFTVKGRRAGIYLGRIRDNFDAYLGPLQFALICYSKLLFKNIICYV